MLALKYGITLPPDPDRGPNLRAHCSSHPIPPRLPPLLFLQEEIQALGH